MNKTKNLLIPILLVVVLLCAVTLPFGLQIQQANANEPEEGGRYSDTVYYFFDYYPTIRYSVMETTYTNHNIVYDRNPNCHNDFANYGNPAGYFDKFDSNCVVIIDIKTFMPEPQHLLELFSFLKAQGCQTMFISIYEEQDFHDRTFLDYVDEFTKTDFSRLIGFIDGLLENEISINSTLENTVFFIDGNLLSVKDRMGAPINELANNIFLRYFLQIIATKIWEIEYIEEIFNENYNYEIIKQTLIDKNISILVHAPTPIDEDAEEPEEDYGEDTPVEFIDILNWRSYSGTTVAEFQGQTTIDGAYTLTFQNACSIGFWLLHPEFYNFLYRTDLLPYSINNYVLEVDPINYSPTGLPIITDSGLAGYDEEEALGKLQDMFPA